MLDEVISRVVTKHAVSRREMSKIFKYYLFSQQRNLCKLVKKTYKLITCQQRCQLVIKTYASTWLQ